MHKGRENEGLGVRLHIRIQLVEENTCHTLL
jgi:hypothetical protein